MPFAVCGYTPSQLRAAYGVGNGGIFDRAAGRGQTVAIVDAYDEPSLESDANLYSIRHGDRPFFGHQFRDLSVPEDPTTGDDCGGNDWYGEQALDVEAVHGMAPAANVLYYGGANCYDDGLMAELTQIVSDNKASIVTNSWGDPTFFVDPNTGEVFSTIDPTLVDAYESIFKQGAVQGIGFFFSSGDNGDDLDAFGVKHPEYPTGDPWVTAVGGTSLAVGRNGNRLFETGWGTDKYTLSTDGGSWTPIDPTDPFYYGAGGGFSQVFKEPWYQFGTVNGGNGGRAVPDIAMDADPTTGMLVGETQNFPAASSFGPAGVHYGEYRVGGTSLASPLMAGAQAVAQGNAGRRTGFANPLIYFLARNPNMFNDITPQGDPGNVRADYANSVNGDDGLVYSVRTFDTDSSLTTGRGWDDVTGVGSVTARYLNSLPSFRH